MFEPAGADWWRLKPSHEASAESRADDIGILKNSITKGGGNVVAVQGEYLVNYLFGGEFETDEILRNEYDLIIDGKKVEVKTQRGNRPPPGVNVNADRSIQECDAFFFCQFFYHPVGRFAGWLTRDEFVALKVLIKKGEQYPGVPIVAKADVWVVQVNQLHDADAWHAWRQKRSRDRKKGGSVMAKELAVQNEKAVSLRTHLFSPAVRETLRDALPKNLTAERLLRVVFSQALKNPRILDCSRESILQCVMQCAQLGLEPILGRAYLVPYNISKQVGGRWVKVMECQMQPGYVGLIDLARRSGKVKSVFSAVVFENDEFLYRLGSDRRLEHRPILRGPAGEPYGAYAYWEMTDGGIHFDFMKIDDIYKRRAKSQAYQYAIANPTNKSAQDCPWIQWPDEMMKKTVVKYTAKMVPASIEFLEVVRMDDATEMGGQYVSPFTESLDQIPERTAEDYARDFDLLVDKVIPGDQRKAFDAYLSEIVNHDGRSDLIVKAEIVSADDFDNMVDAFKASIVVDKPIHGVKDKLFPDGRRGVGNPAYNRPPDGTTIGGKAKTDPDPWVRDKWIGLQKGSLENGTGLWAYVVEHRKSLSQMPMDLFNELTGKFSRIYKKSFPYNPDGDVEADVEASESNAEADAGADDQAGADDVPEGFADAVQRLYEMGEQYPKAYAKIVGDKTPQTVEDIERMLEEITQCAHFMGETNGNRDARRKW